MNNYGPKVTWEQLQPGVRFYYTGDMANPSGNGVITERLPIDPKWKYKNVKLRWDDERETFSVIGLESFQPAPGRRFWLETDWEADRQRRIAEMTGRFGDALRKIEAARKETA